MLIGVTVVQLVEVFTVYPQQGYPFLLRDVMVILTSNQLYMFSIQIYYVVVVYECHA